MCMTIKRFDSSIVSTPLELRLSSDAKQMLHEHHVCDSFHVSVSPYERALILGSGTLAKTFLFHDPNQFFLLTQPMTVFLDDSCT